jgi:hypothetical protein
MFAQGGLCYFCNAILPKAEASVEHLVASANGGSNADGNCVACCKSINSLFGSMSLKEKLKVVLNQKGNFKCPNGIGQIAPSTSVSKQPTPVPAAAPIKAKVDNYSIVLADLKKRGTSKPRKVETLKSTISATLKKQITPAQLDALLKHLEVNGKITISGTKVAYSL